MQNELRRQNWLAITELLGEIFTKQKHSIENYPRQYWHYTSANGLMGIFDSYINNLNNTDINYVQRCSILASNIRFMNDSKEYKDGTESYNKFCQEKKEELGNKKRKKNREKNLLAYLNSPTSLCCNNENIYLISFCGNGDLLSQWKWYGKDSGVAIKFNIDNIIYKTYNISEQLKCSDANEDFYDFHTRPLPVQYFDSDKKSYFDSLLQAEKIADSNEYQIAQLAFVPFCKDQGFIEEQESRLVFYTCDLMNGESFNIKYNSFEKGRIKPALNVEMKYSPSPENTLSKNIISQIIVGPGQNQNIVFNLLIHIFDRKNYFFHEENEIVKDPECIDETTFLTSQTNQNIYRVHWQTQNPLKSKDDKQQYVTRDSYKCANGIIIMKSSIPFRG